MQSTVCVEQKLLKLKWIESALTETKFNKRNKNPIRCRKIEWKRRKEAREDGPIGWEFGPNCAARMYMLSRHDESETAERALPRASHEKSFRTIPRYWTGGTDWVSSSYPPLRPLICPQDRRCLRRFTSLFAAPRCWKKGTPSVFWKKVPNREIQHGISYTISFCRIAVSKWSIF